jgi:purine-nucleoside phosphorylase
MPRTQRLPDPAATAAIIAKRIQLRPELGIVLGSGFGPIASALTPDREFSYRDLPGFPQGTAPGHAGRLVVGVWHGVPLVVLSGRAHYYEGFDLGEVTFATRVLAALGVKTLLLTNAAGAIHEKYRVGDFMILSDHINFLGTNPLRGPVLPGMNRFIDMTRTYDETLRTKLLQAGKSARATVHQGVYLAVSGPSFETPAEIRAFGRWGADAVGMSTVPEAIMARACGVRVAGLSCLTNAAAGLGGPKQVVTSDEVLEVAHRREAMAVKLVGEFVRRCAA